MKLDKTLSQRVPKVKWFLTGSMNTSTINIVIYRKSKSNAPVKNGCCCSSEETIIGRATNTKQWFGLNSQLAVGTQPHSKETLEIGGYASELSVS